MDRIGIAVCDDEKAVHEEVGRLLNKYPNPGSFQYQIFHCFSAKELLEISEDIQIVLLDIDMPGTDGIQAARELEKKGEKKCIIMLTGKRERFKDAIKIGVVRFVTKPIEEKEFFEAVEYALLSLTGYETIKLNYKGVQCAVQQREIQVVEACRDYLKIYTKEKEFESNQSLKMMEEELDRNLFASPHRSYYINLMHVCEIQKEKIKMDGGRLVPMSRRNKKDIIQRIIDFDRLRN